MKARAQWKEWVPYLTLVAVLAAYLVIELLLYKKFFVFEAETDAYFRRAWALASGEGLTWRGPPMGPFQLHHGPLFYGVLAAFMSVSPALEWLWVVWLGLSALGAFFLFLACKRHVPWPAAVFAVLGLLSSTFAFESGRQLWHASLLPAVACGVLLALERGLSTHKLRYFIIAAAASAVAVQLHIHAIGYTLLLGGVLVYRWRSLGARGLAACVAVFLVVSAPLSASIVQVLSGAGRGQIAGWLAIEPEGGFLANPVDVVAYFLAHMSPAWGSTFAPLFLGVWVVLMTAGAVFAIKRRHAFGIVLCINVAIGLSIQSVLWGYMWAPWYLHVNIYAAFGLCAFGLAWVSEWLSRLNPRGARVGAVAMAVAGALLVVDGVATPTNVNVTATPALTASEAVRVARFVASIVPNTSDVSARVHGLYFSEPELLIGVGYLHETAAEGTTGTSTDNVLVSLPEYNLIPLATSKPIRHVIQGEGRQIIVSRYQSAVDLLAMTIEGPYADVLMARWRDLEFHPPPGEYTHQITLPVHRAGWLNLLLRIPGGPEQSCQVAGLLDGKALTVIEDDKTGFWTRLLKVRVPTAGQIELTIGPCTTVPYVDVF